jgi:CubicO group peptidase (beta-lactamase class C family)
MKKYLLILTVCVSFSIQAQQKDDVLKAALDEFMTEKFPAKEPGAVALVIREGNVLLRKGYGLASINPQVPLTPESIFKIGSVTKQFTSTAILKLAQENKLNLKDDLTKYFPGLTDRKITIENLLHHTSGIKSYTSLPQLMTPEKKKAGITPDELLGILKNEKPDFEPGEKYLYNNSGYYLLGLIIEKVSGLKYEEYLAKNFFKPLGMKHTFMNDSNLPKQVAIGFRTSGPDAFEPDHYVHPSIPFSAGALYSTVDDLWKWNQAVFSYKLVKKEWMEKAWIPLTLNNGKQENYGYAWQLGRLDNKKVIGHGGAIDGYICFELYEPESKIYVSILTNVMKVNPEDYAYDLAEMVKGVSVSKPARIALDENKLQEYTGVYAIDDTNERIITMRDKKLYSMRTGSSRFEIIPYAEDAFYFDGTLTRVKFLRDQTGKIIASESAGRDWLPSRATKTNKPIPAETKEIEIEAAVFDAYVGEYELAPGFVIKVWREEKRFKAQATGQPPFDLFAESERKFFLKVVDAKIEFNRDDNSQVVGMTLFQNGQIIPGKKIK